MANKQWHLSRLKEAVAKADRLQKIVSKGSDVDSWKTNDDAERAEAEVESAKYKLVTLCGMSDDEVKNIEQ